MKKVLKGLLMVSLVICLTAGIGLAKTKTTHNVAWLGVYTQTVDDDLTEAFDLPVKYGAIINEVVEDSPADEAGLQEDDIIVEINGKKIRDSDDLINMIQDSEPGDKISVTLMTGDNKEKTIEIVLGERKTRNYKVWTSDDDEDFDLGNHGFYFFSDDGKSSYIGVTLTDLSDQLAEFFGVSEDKGVLINSVEKDSPAEKAGLKAGDVIVEVDSETVEDSQDVQKIIRSMDVGDIAKITVLRDKSQRTFDVEIAENDDNKQYGTWNLNIPDLPKMNIRIPKVKGLRQGVDVYDFDSDDLYFDSNEYEEEMQELQKELQELKEELKDIRKKLD
ncbi:MAG: PDZ domain-containing protein [Candidatus Zixiibacteriota bacterium]